ncbi:tRNA 2-selenouridine(34) synthase MnmH [Sulfurimonas crateris]|uniref:tRNA 2-selenouridine(34) synthase MnmH n=1 Tax=Sulfurimonas crateris TaxID=2574727 RepID=A0A4U2Z7W9_9BACT|nr:tRNA 2-selenouridine(34) synthase MnmH [Sulfurimonas crateris]TKI69985.1 tRNA 2-selenouridine(34) synthase MnmH [Sulfurimonas crateris]
MSKLFDDFKSIVLNNTPLIDVRAPVEFKKGAFLNAVNLPIMSDEERHEVGICYKNKGNAKAIELGHELVSGEIKEQRVQAWLSFMDANPDTLLYCFRGGQRSRIAQEWIGERGREIVRLKGGYKAFRSYLLDELENSYNHFKPLLLGGRTGSGKTIELKKMQNAIDLEGLANHRGSSFGQKITQQTTQIDFENNMIYKIVQKAEEGFKTLVFEDEGKHVGSVFMPESFIEILPKAPLVILETPMDERIEITLNEYVVDAQKTYEGAEYVDAFEAWQLDIKSAMERIKRRLGDQRYREVSAIFEDALGEQKRSGSYEKYKEWVEYLLREYYDPMYDYQIQKRSHLVAFRGDAKEVHEYIKSIV